MGVWQSCFATVLCHNATLGQFRSLRWSGWILYLQKRRMLTKTKTAPAAEPPDTCKNLCPAKLSRKFAKLVGQKPASMYWHGSTDVPSVHGVLLSRSDATRADERCLRCSAKVAWPTRQITWQNYMTRGLTQQNKAKEFSCLQQDTVIMCHSEPEEPTHKAKHSG